MEAAQWRRRYAKRVTAEEMASIKLIACSRCKTDKIDSKILMELLAKGFLPTTCIPSSDERKYHASLLVFVPSEDLRAAYYELRSIYTKSISGPFEKDSLDSELIENRSCLHLQRSIQSLKRFFKVS
jgi:hypothetical protein